MKQENRERLIAGLLAVLQLAACAQQARLTGEAPPHGGGSPLTRVARGAR